MWRNQRRWLAPGERYALCLVVWNQGSRAKRASEIQPKIPGDVFFWKTKQQWLYVYIYICTNHVYHWWQKECDLLCPKFLGNNTVIYCHIISQQHMITLAKMTSALSVWKLMMTPSAPARFWQNQPFNQRNPKNPQKTMCGKWPWPCAVSSPQQKTSSPFEASQACRNVSEFLA